MGIALLSFFLTYCIVCAVRTFPMELSEDKEEELDAGVNIMLVFSKSGLFWLL